MRMATAARTALNADERMVGPGDLAVADSYSYSSRMS